MAEPPVDYQISAADAHELAGAVLLPADLRRQVLEKMAAQRDLAAMLDLFAQVLGMANAVAENCRAMVELILIERGEHPHRGAGEPTDDVRSAARRCPGRHCGPTRHVRRLCLSPRHPGEHLAGHHHRCHLLPAGTQPVLLPRRPGRPGNPVRTCVGHAKAMKQDATK